MSVEEIARSTRVPMDSVTRIEADQFDAVAVPVTPPPNMAPR